MPHVNSHINLNQRDIADWFLCASCNIFLLIDVIVVQYRTNNADLLLFFFFIFWTVCLFVSLLLCFYLVDNHTPRFKKKEEEWWSIEVFLFLLLFGLPLPFVKQQASDVSLFNFISSFIFLILILSGQTIYLNPSATCGFDCNGGQSAPYVSFNQLVSRMNNDKSDTYDVYLAPGVYNGLDNIALILSGFTRGVNIR